MKLASIIRTRFNPLNFLRHRARSSLDSGAATTQLVGGRSHRSQSRQKCITAWRSMPCETSFCFLMQSKQNAPADVWPSMGALHSQQRILNHPEVRSGLSCVGRGIRGTLSKTYVAPVRAVPARDTMGTGASRSIECDMVGESALLRWMAVVGSDSRR